MRSCPHCGGEIRASVIRCVHCGTALLEEEQPVTVPAGAGPSTPEGAPSAATQAAPPPRPPGVMPGRPTAPAPSVFDAPKPRPTDPWVTPSVRADDHAPLPMPPEVETRPDPAGSRRPDARLMAAGALALVSAVAAASALSLPWVTGRVSVVGQRSNARLVADLTFRASDSLAGPFVVGVAAVLALAGLLWFWYGMDRTAHLPSIGSPGIAVLAGVVGVGTLAASRAASFLWQDAFIENARDAGLTKEAMRTVLEAKSAPLIQLEPQGGMARFAVAAALAVLAGLVAWWSQRRRGWA